MLFFFDVELHVHVVNRKDMFLHLCEGHVLILFFERFDNAFVLTGYFPDGFMVHLELVHPERMYFH